MISQFEELLHSLGKVFRLSLHVDRSHACSIQVHGDLMIQLQLDVSQENLWIFSKLVELPAGTYRENILREALKTNGLPEPRTAVLGYIAKTNHLALFQKYPLTILSGDRLAGLIGAILEMADSWRKAVATGQNGPPPPQELSPNVFRKK